jgi:DNA helicase-2/ATP-dependent DNA helicase PcrA
VLNEQQQNIVILNKGKHIVLAPPGTGKTDILSYRVAHAIKLGVDDKKIINLIFNNRAAREMKTRIEEHGIKTNAFIGNIHSFCLEFLKNRGIFKNNMFLDPV